MSFKNLNLNAKSLYLVDILGFKKPTEIQEKIIPKVLKNRNVIAQSPTGSGKTHSFLLPILQNIDMEYPHTQVLIVLPTRELAIQINAELKKIKGDVSSVILTGGADRVREAERLVNSQIVVGTPGRIVEHIKNRSLSLSKLRTICFDEADMLFDLGYNDELQVILEDLNYSAQKLLFSATFSVELQNVFAKYLQNPEIVILQKKSFKKDSITNYLINDKVSRKNEQMLKLVNHINPFVCLIFCSKRDEVDDVFEYLASNGVKNIVKLHSKLEPRKRKKILLDLRENKYQYIVASDIAARGIDIDGVSHVINYSLSDDKYFIHRIGRTGRFDRQGETYTFYNVELEQLINKYENKGLEFKLVKFDSEDNLVSAGDRQQRKKRQNFDQKIDEEAWNKVRKVTKVKPGYKKKMKAQKDRIKRKMKRDFFKDQAKKTRIRNAEKGSKF